MDSAKKALICNPGDPATARSASNMKIQVIDKTAMTSILLSPICIALHKKK